MGFWKKKHHADTASTRPVTLQDIRLLQTVGTGTFGRVQLCQINGYPNFYAMKILRKSDVVRLKQVEHIMSEKYILSQINHPNVVNLMATFTTETYLYMMMEFVPGGELFTHLRRAGRFDLNTATFFAAQIVLAFEYLHQRDIVYRDLKPENLLLDAKGNLKITDFGFAKVVQDRTWTLCGTPEYLAPEIIQSKGHNKGVDWWGLGILVYEMLAGYPPFFDDSPFAIYEKILAGRIQFPSYFTTETRDLIRRLLTTDRSRRLGCMRYGTEEVKAHSFFQHVDWQLLAAQGIRSPLCPNVAHPGDTSNFDRYEEVPLDNSTTGQDEYAGLFENF